MISKVAKIGKPVTWLMQVIIILFSFAHSLEGKDFAHKKLKGIKVEGAHAGISASFENRHRSQKATEESIPSQQTNFNYVFVQDITETVSLAKPFIVINFYQRNFFYVYNSQSAP